MRHVVWSVPYKPASRESRRGKPRLPVARSLGLLAILAAVQSPAAWAQIALVHVTTCGSGAFPATTCTIPATGSGHLIAVAWSSTWGTTPTITSVTDNAGNSYVEAGAARSVLSTSDMVDIWYAKNSGAGATTVTITPNPSGTTGAAVIWEYSNLDLVAPLDQTAVLNSQPATTTPAGASVTTTGSSDAVISVVVPASSITGSYTGNPFIADSLFFGTGWAHLITSAGGTYAAQWNTGSGSYASSTVAFKAAASGSGSTQNPCDLNNDGTVNTLDVQLAVNMALGMTSCTASIDGAGICTAAVVQRVVDASMGAPCVVGNSHSVTLTWNASTSANVAGYNVYRGTASGGPYTKLNSSLVPSLTYQDTTVQSGQTYYYVTTAVDGSGNESTYSNQAQAVIPYP